MKYEINLTRAVARRSDVAVAKKALQDAIASSLSKKSRINLRQLAVRQTDNGFVAKGTFVGTTQASFDIYLEGLKEKLVSRFSPPWFVSTEEEIALAGADEPVESPVSDPGYKEVESVPVGKINLDLPDNTFERLYGREAQIRRVLDALSLGESTGWKKRKHTLLSGPPGCGKTELMLCLSRALGREGEAWLWFDSTSTTRAGAVEQLMKAPVVPPVLFVEEIEKTQESALRWLLGVMDERGEIRRNNYRTGNQHKAIKLALVATANNVELLKQMDSGALYSRFANRIHCPEPDRDTLEKILNREVHDVDRGDAQWVEETLKFGYDTLGIGDPRELINMLLCGRDRLLDGTYQKDFSSTLSPEEAKRIEKLTAKVEERLL
jgi:energy-coupling factor transporter ATP-binding protein EcfA2